MRKLNQPLWDAAKKATTEDDPSDLRYAGIFRDRRFTSYNMAIAAFIICGILSLIATNAFGVDRLWVAVGYLAALAIAPLLGHASSLSGKLRVFIVYLIITIIFLPVFLLISYIADSMP